MNEHSVTARIKRRLPPVLSLANRAEMLRPMFSPIECLQRASFARKFVNEHLVIQRFFNRHFAAIMERINERKWHLLPHSSRRLLNSRPFSGYPLVSLRSLSSSLQKLFSSPITLGTTLTVCKSSPTAIS